MDGVVVVEQVGIEGDAKHFIFERRMRETWCDRPMGKVGVSDAQRTRFKCAPMLYDF